MPSEPEQQTDPLGDDGCFEWTDTGLRCGYSRSAHSGEIEHEFVSRAEFEARGAKGFEQHRSSQPQSAASMLADMRKAREQAENFENAATVGEALKTYNPPRAYNARDALVRVDADCVLNPAAITAMLEDTMTHRDGAAVKTTVRTSIFLASRAAPIVVEAPLDEVLRRITTARYENERTEQHVEKRDADHGVDCDCQGCGDVRSVFP